MAGHDKAVCFIDYPDKLQEAVATSGGMIHHGCFMDT